MSFAKIGRSDPNREMIPLVSEAGTPGTRLSSHLLHRWGRNMMIPIICPDRPGMGHSTYVKNYTVASHAQDVIFLVNHSPITKCMDLVLVY
jgi:pimeloyl-ACP methyl ester carboxylesterase